MNIDLANLDITSIVTLVVCGLVVVAAIVRFIIHIVSNRKDK